MLLLEPIDGIQPASDVGRVGSDRHLKLAPHLGIALGAHLDESVDLHDMRRAETIDDFRTR